MTEENGAPLLTQEELDALFGKLNAGKPQRDRPVAGARDVSDKATGENVVNEAETAVQTDLSRDAAPRSGELPTSAASVAGELVRKSGHGMNRRVLDRRGQAADAFRAILQAFSKIPVTISVRVGKASASLKEISAMGPGTVVRLDTLMNEPVKLLIDDVVIAEGEVVEVGGYFGVRIKTTRTVIG